MKWNNHERARTVISELIKENHIGIGFFGPEYKEAVKTAEKALNLCPSADEKILEENKRMNLKVYFIQ